MSITSYTRLETGERADLLTGNCHEAVKAMADAGIRFDAMVTDPPYGVGSWDWGIPSQETWKVLLDAMKPGALALVTGNTKTFHRQTTWMEDAGWEILDCLMWVFSHGYSGKIGEASWAVHKELMGDKAEIQRGHYIQDAIKWKGWGSKLKPAWEPIMLFQAPGESSIAKNLIRHGVGAMNFNPEPSPRQTRLFDGLNQPEYPPLNIVMDDEARDILASENPTRDVSRMFFCRMVSQKERNAGVTLERMNDHPTVKPIGLMRWLISLITPPGGLLLDPFVGSGTTGCAAMLEDVKFVGVDLDPQYIEIAKQRVAWWAGEKAAEDRNAPGLFVPKVAMSRIMGRTGLGMCRNGHRLTPGNVYFRPDGRKECKICKRLARKRVKF